jgi:hypothetical protein
LGGPNSDAARHWVNTAIHQYLIPATQIGIKIPVDAVGNVGEIHTVTRLFMPGDGCMWCNQLIDPTGLAIDMHPTDERQAARYVPGVAAPSVITLNALAAAEVVNHFMLAATGLHDDNTSTASVLHFPRRRDRALQSHRRDIRCPWCSTDGILGRGDAISTRVPRTSKMNSKAHAEKSAH